MRATDEQELLRGVMPWRQAVFGAVVVGVACGIGVRVLSAAAQFLYEPKRNLLDDLFWFGIVGVLFPSVMYLVMMRGFVKIDRAVLWYYRVRGIQFGADRPLPFWIRIRNIARVSGQDEFLSTLTLLYAVMFVAQSVYDDYTTTTGQAILLFALGFLTAFWISELTKRTLGKKYKWYKLIKDFDDDPKETKQ